MKNTVSVILNAVYGVKNLWTLARKKLCLCIQIFRFAQQLVFAYCPQNDRDSMSQLGSSS